MNWIENSNFYKLYGTIFPYDDFIKDTSLLPEFPKELTNKNIRWVLNIVRFFNVVDINYLYPCFVFLLTSDIKGILNKEFPELKELFNDTCINSSEDACKTGNVLCFKYIHLNKGKIDFENLCSVAAKYGNLDCLKYAYEIGCKLDSTVSMYAAKTDLKCLKYVHEMGCEWDVLTTSNAAKNGNIETLRYAHMNGCEWSSLITISAAKNGHLNCLKYAHVNGCEWSAEVCSYAARFGHLDCLKYAHEYGCPWNEETSTNALIYKKFPCYSYVMTNKCPVDPNARSIKPERTAR